MCRAVAQRVRKMGDVGGGCPLEGGEKRKEVGERKRETKRAATLTPGRKTRFASRTTRSPPPFRTPSPTYTPFRAIYLPLICRFAGRSSQLSFKAVFRKEDARPYMVVADLYEAQLFYGYEPP